MPHEYRSWYHHHHDGRREGPILEGDIPLFVLEAAFGKRTADPKDELVVDAKDPKFEGDPESPIYSARGANWSEEEGEIVEQEEESEEDQEWEEPEEDLEEDPEEEELEEEDLEEDPEYDPDED